MTLPYLSNLSEAIPTLISVEFTFDFSIFLIMSGGWLCFDLSFNL